MKYALISEEQIKQLTEAIYAPLNKDALAVLNARAIIKSLKPSEPVGYKSSRGQGSVAIFPIKSIFDDVPLFALDKEQA